MKTAVAPDGSAACGTYDGGAKPIDVLATTELSDAGASANMSHAAIDVNGQATVVWAESIGLNRNLMSAQYDLTTAKWTTIMVATGTDYLVDPRVAVDGQGNAVATWTIAGSAGVKASRLPAGSNAWVELGTVYAGQLDEVLAQDISISASGQGIVAWSTDGGGVGARWISSVDAGLPFAGATVFPGVTGTGLRVAVGADTAMVAWRSRDAGVYALQLTLDGGTWQTKTYEVVSVPADASTVALSVSPSGVVAAWSAYDPVIFDWNVYATQYSPSAGWLVPGVVDTLDASVTALDVAINSASQSVVAWLQSPGFGGDIWASVGSAGAGFGVDMSPAWGSSGTQLWTAMEPTGVVLVLWQNGNDLLGARSNRAGDVWTYVASMAFPLISTTGPAGPFSAAMNADGYGVAVWHETESSSRDIVRAAVFR